MSLNDDRKIKAFLFEYNYMQRPWASPPVEAAEPRSTEALADAEAVVQAEADWRTRRDLKPADDANAAPAKFVSVLSGRTPPRRH